jgi:signal transduction protein with GAF and PtsI domain
MPKSELLDRIEKLTAEGDSDSRAIQRVLEAIAADFGAQSATIHRADKEFKILRMEASLGLPEHIQRVTEKIPFGKGMAGICYERAEPITVCNLQTDDSGVAKPGAKETQVAGAIVMPIFDKEGREVIGTLGVGKPQAHDYTEEEQKILAGCAGKIANLWQA